MNASLLRLVALPCFPNMHKCVLFEGVCYFNQPNFNAVIIWTVGTSRGNTTDTLSLTFDLCGSSVVCGDKLWLCFNPQVKTSKAKDTEEQIDPNVIVTLLPLHSDCNTVG